MTFGENDPDADELRRLPLGERIYRIRKSLDLSQAEIAEKVGVNIKTVNRWENDQADPRRQSRAALAEMSGYPESFFKRKSPPPSLPEGEAASVAAELAEIRAALETMSTRREAFRTELARQLKSQTDLLATLTAAGVELRGLIGDLREAREATPRPSRERRSA